MIASARRPGITVLAAGVFLGAAWALGPVPATLAPACLVVVLGYSFFKRLSWASHLVLGLALSLAPGGAWMAVTGGFAGWPVPVLLMLAVATWVAGFDILYSLGDVDFDRREGLHSIPATFGIGGALVLSGALHVGTVAAMVGVQLVAGLGWAHALGVAAVVAILAYEHAIVRPSDLSPPRQGVLRPQRLGEPAVSRGGAGRRARLIRPDGERREGEENRTQRLRVGEAKGWLREDSALRDSFAAGGPEFRKRATSRRDGRRDGA